jgi:RsiW-degrading membrane proteinase PrsW (M82 family)
MFNKRFLFSSQELVLMTNSTKKCNNSFHKPGFQEKIFFLISGIITSVPLTLFANLFTDSLCIGLPIFYAQICSIAIFTPFIEEFAKAYPLFYRHGESVQSLFILGFLVGLGFGFAEFLLYVFTYNQPWFVRFPGLFFHACSTSIVAYGIKIGKSWLFYIIAVVLHFSINFAALISELWIIATIALSLSYYLSWYLYQRTQQMQSTE